MLDGLASMMGNGVGAMDGLASMMGAGNIGSTPGVANLVAALRAQQAQQGGQPAGGVGGMAGAAAPAMGAPGAGPLMRQRAGSTMVPGVSPRVMALANMMRANRQNGIGATIPRPQPGVITPTPAGYANA